MRGSARPPAPASVPGTAQPTAPAHPRPPLPGGPYVVLGLARSGHAAALALAQRGERVIGIDAGTPAGVEALAGAGVEVHTSQKAVALPAQARTLVKSPGVGQQAPALLAARRAGVSVIGELELGWRLLANEFIAVTGTNGKTTTAELIGHIHREAGLPVAVAGNVGTALTSIVDTAPERATIVCEVSSFQLEDTVAFAPEAAVLVNLTPDHLDRHGSFEAYAKAKSGAFARQGEGDVAVLPQSLCERRASLSEQSAGALDARLVLGEGRARRVSFGSGAGAALHEHDGELSWQGRPLLGAGELALQGRHNLENAMAAAAACLARGVEAQAVREALRSFTGVKHRLEQIATRGGVTYINDSKATNVASTLVALDALAHAPGVHLILGGQGKGQDFTSLRGPAARLSGVYLIGEDAAVIEQALAGAGVAARICGELARAVAAAAGAAREGEVVLLSPACASFDQFRDFEARGERFRELVCA